MYKKNESSRLHVKGDFLIHISVQIVTFKEKTAGYVGIIEL